MFSPRAALDHLAQVTAPDGPVPAGSPRQDHCRSPAAAVVSDLAMADGLFLFDFEARVELDLPDGWVERGYEDDAAPSQWIDGRLPERKYQSFRHDLMIGSFHPGHRGKWSSHELCHALVGFHWAPDATRFQTATAARLAELLPVLLYYFIDEVRLTRCPDHQSGGALYREYCSRCEALAAMRPVADGDLAHLEDAARFLDRELAAIARSRRLGRPIAHRFGSLDLCTDGIAYARAHGQRLKSPVMERMDPFLLGNHTDLDALEARVGEVARGILLGEPVVPWGGEPEAWMRADLAYRMLTTAATHPDGATEIFELVDRLSEGELDLYWDWDDMADDLGLPTADAVFSVGYRLPYGGIGVRQIASGLRTVCPLVMELAEDAGVALVPEFMSMMPPERRPLGDRFADWLSGIHPTLAPLARLESAMRSVRSDPLILGLGGAGTGLELSPEARILREPYDVVEVSEGVDAGEIQGAVRAGVLGLDPAPDAVRVALAITRDGAGELVMAELPTTVADALDDPTGLGDVQCALIELGVLRCKRW